MLDGRAHGDFAARGCISFAASIAISGPGTVKDLATLVRLSEFHFNVAFRNSVGELPHGYTIRRRVERAQGLR